MNPIAMALFYSTLTSRFKMEFFSKLFQTRIIYEGICPYFKMPKIPLMHVKYLKIYP
jgi:hypothetical protein